MTAILSGFLHDLLSMAFEAFDDAMLWMLESMLHVETLLGSVAEGLMTGGTVNDVYLFIYRFACSLIVLKFLFRGFEIYILWRDGDADSSPQDMLIGTAQGIVVMVCFPYLYDIMAEVTVWFTDGVMGRFGLGVDTPFWPTMEGVQGLSLFIMILLVVYVVLSVVLYLKLIKRGFELLILRLGVPIACLGLVDSDMGLFKGYLQTFFKTMFTTVIQLTLMSFSVRVIANVSFSSIVIGIAIIMTAFGAPSLMQHMLISTGHGGGITNKIYSAGMAARTVKGLLGK